MDCAFAAASPLLAERVIPDGVDAGESNPGAKRLCLSGSAAIHEATTAAQRFAHSVGIEEANAARLAIVVEELVANLYDHGGLTMDDEFHIELTATGEEVTLVVVDPGRPFDLAHTARHRQIPARGGGAGLALVRAWASRTEYRSEAGSNWLCVTLPLQASND